MRLKCSFNLVIVGGDGWGNLNRRKKVSNLALNDKVLFRSYVSNSELAMLYKYAYCLVMPLLYEGFGLPIIEAQSFGVPVIISNISSMPEVAGKGALLIKSYSIESIQDALETLLSDEKLRSQLLQMSKENA